MEAAPEQDTAWCAGLRPGTKTKPQQVFPLDLVSESSEAPRDFLCIRERVSSHLQPHRKTIDMARTWPSKSEGSLKSACRRYSSLQPNSTSKGCRATVGAHASCVLLSCKRCHSRVGTFRTCTTVRGAAMKEGLGTPRKSCAVYNGRH